MLYNVKYFEWSEDLESALMNPSPLNLLALLTKANKTVPVNESNDDVLDIDVLMELSTGTQERVQGLKMKLIWENLRREMILVQA